MLAGRAAIFWQNLRPLSPAVYLLIAFQNLTKNWKSIIDCFYIITLEYSLRGIRNHWIFFNIFISFGVMTSIIPVYLYILRYMRSLYVQWLIDGPDQWMGRVGTCPDTISWHTDRYLWQTPDIPTDICDRRLAYRPISVTDAWHTDWYLWQTPDIPTDIYGVAPYRDHFEKVIILYGL